MCLGLNHDCYECTSVVDQNRLEIFSAIVRVGYWSLVKEDY